MGEGWAPKETEQGRDGIEKSQVAPMILGGEWGVRGEWVGLK